MSDALANMWNQWVQANKDADARTRNSPNPAVRALNYGSNQAASLLSGAGRIIADIPANAYGLYTLAAGGVDYARSDDPNATYLDLVQQRRYGQDGYQKLTQYEDAKAQEFMQQNPGATEDDKARFMAQLIRSDEYLTFERDILGPIVGGSEMIGDTIDKAVGAPVDPDKTAIEMGLASGVQSFIPIAGATRRFLPDSATGRVLGTAAEVVLPGSFLNNRPLQAVEAAIGGGLTAGLTATFDELTDNQRHILRDEVPEFDPDNDLEEIVNEPQGWVSTLDIAGLTAVLAGIRRFGNVGFNTPTPNRTFAEGGPGGPLNPPQSARKSNWFARATGENAAVLDNVDAIGPKGITGEEAVNDLGINSRVATQQTIDLVDRRGYWPDGSQTIPVNQIRDAAKIARQEGWFDQVNTWKQAGSELDAREFYVNSIFKQISDIDTKQAEAFQGLQKATADLANATKASQRATINSRIAKLNDKYQATVEAKNKIVNGDEYKGVMADDPKYRIGLTNVPTAELRRIVNDGNNNPKFRQLDAGYKQVMDKLADMQKDWVGADGVAAMKAAHPRYMPMRHAIHMGKGGELTGVRRLWSSISRQMKFDEDIFSNSMGDSFSVGSPSGRSRDNRQQDKVNQPGNFLEALDFAEDNILRKYNQNQMRKSITENVITKARLNGVRPPLEVLKRKGRQWFSEAEVRRMIDTGYRNAKGNLIKLNPASYTIVANNGKFAFYKWDDPDMQVRMDDVPHASIPIAREAARIWQTLTTGWLNVGFGLKSATYDALTSNITRPKGSVQGLDAAVDSVLRLAGAPVDGPLRTNVRQAARYASSLTVVDPVGFALQMHAATSAFARDMQHHWTQKIVNDLANDYGLFGKIAENPDGRRHLERIAQASLNSMARSTYFQFVEARSMNAESIQPLIAQNREYEKLITAELPKGFEYITSPIVEILRTLKFFGGALRKSSQLAYAYRNKALLLERTGGRTDTPSYREGIKNIQRETMKLTGDFNERPGSKALQGLSSISPYTNVMLVSNRHLYRSMKANPGQFAMMITGLASAKIASEIMMAGWDKDAYDRHYRMKPLWERVGTVVLPTPATVLAWSRGETVPYSDEAVYPLSIANEFRPMVEAMVQGVRATRIWGMGQDEKIAENHGYAAPVAEAIKQAYGLVTPPIAGVLLASQGITADPGAAFTGGRMFDSSGEAYRDRSINVDPNNQENSSDITQGTMATIGAIFGMIGRTAVLSWDVGDRVADDDGLAAGVLAGVSEFGSRVTSMSTDTPVTGLLGPRVAERVYQRTPVSEQANAMREAMTMTRYPNALKPIGEPIIDAALYRVGIYASRDPRLKAFSQQYQELNEQIQTARNNKQLNYGERQEVLTDLLRRFAEFNKNQSVVLREIEDDISKATVDQGVTMDQAFQQKYDMPFSLENFVEVAKMYKNRQ